MQKMQSFQEESSGSHGGEVTHEFRNIELTDLAKENIKHEQKSVQQQVLPPDGGKRAYMVLLCAFSTFGVSTAVMAYYGSEINYTNLYRHPNMKYFEYLTYDKAFILAPIAGLVADKITLRYTSLLGGLLSTSGLFFSQYLIYQLVDYSVTYFILGCVIILGTALSLTSAYAILGHYFKRHLGKASGFVMMAAHLVLCILYKLPLDGLQFKYQILSLFSSLIIVASIAFKPLLPVPQKCLRIKFDKWKFFKFLTYAIGVFVAMIGMIVHSQAMLEYMQKNFPDKHFDFFSHNLYVVINSSAFLISGIIADLCHRNRFMLQEILFVCIGSCNIVIAFVCNYILSEILYTVSTLVSCCTITLFCPIAFEIFGPSGATHALGVLMSLWAWSWNLGNGIFYYFNHAGCSISSLFVLAGFFPIIGAVVMFVALRLLDRHTRRY